MDKAKIKKIGKIALDVLLYIFLAICIFAVIVTVVATNEQREVLFGKHVNRTAYRPVFDKPVFNGHFIKIKTTYLKRMYSVAEKLRLDSAKIANNGLLAALLY